MSRVRWPVVVAAVTLGATAPARAGDSIDPDWLEKLTRDGRAAVQQYEAVAAAIEEVYETRTEKLDRADPKTSPNFAEHTDRYRFVRVGDHLLVERTRTNDRQPDKPQCSLDGLNRVYCFALSRARPDAPYALASYADAENERTKTWNTRSHVALHRNAFDYLRQVLEGVDGSRKQTLIGVGWDEARQAVRIVTTFPLGDRTTRDELWVDPAQNWRTTEVRIETPSLRSVMTLTYGREVGGVTFPESSQNVTKYTVAGAPPDLRITSRVESIRVADQGEEAFRLSAFGLPEPVGIKWARPTPRYVWFLAAAGVFVALAVGFRYLARRRAAAVAAQGAT